MIAMSKNQLRADEYRGRAAEATALAVAAILDRVRERHEAAAARWMDLARLNERQADAQEVRTAETKRQLILAALPPAVPCTA